MLMNIPLLFLCLCLCTRGGWYRRSINALQVMLYADVVRVHVGVFICFHVLIAECT